MQGSGYSGDVQRMQAPPQEMWEQQSAAQQQSMPQQPPPQQPLPQQPPSQRQSTKDDFEGGAPQSFFGEMPPPGSVRLFG